jgi:uncharacterized protein (DUF2344 family)
MATGSVMLTDVNTKVSAAGTVEKLAEVADQLMHEEIHVFDTTKFTVNGAFLDEYMADVDSDAEFDKLDEIFKRENRYNSDRSLLEKNKKEIKEYYDSLKELEK